MSEPLREEDMALAVAFVDGELADPDRARFERRLAAEPALADAVEGLLVLDERLRADARTGAREAFGTRLRALPARRRMWIAALAAALLAAFVTGLFVRRSPPPVDLRVALAEGFESPRAWLEQAPELVGLRQPGLDTLRSGGEEPNVAADEFVARARVRERAIAGAALGSGASSVVAGYFVVPVRVDRPVSVVVLARPARGEPMRLWPAAGATRPAAEQGRLQPGEHVVPAERFDLAPDAGRPEGQRVVYSRGFLVPVGARELTVLVAAREDLLDEETLAALDAALARGTERGELERRRFRVSELRVREPL